MTRRRGSIAALLVAAALALTGCGGGAEPGPAGQPAPSPAASQPEPSPAASEGESAPAAMGLVGVVGTADDPEAYEIALTDDSGAPVTSLPAGDYTLTFADLATQHNFRLSGPGDVDVATDVAGTDESSVDITLVPGTYTFVCDPHSGSMRGEVEVTG